MVDHVLFMAAQTDLLSKPFFQSSEYLCTPCQLYNNTQTRSKCGSTAYTGTPVGEG